MQQLVAGLLSLVVGLGLFSAGSFAGSNTLNPQGQTVRWNPAVPIPFVINPGGVPGFTGELERLVVEGAVRDAFRAWAELPGAAVSLAYGGTSSLTLGAPDFVNLVSFQDISYSFAPGVLAVTVLRGTATEIRDADILFNPQPPDGKPFSPVGGDNSLDLVAVGIHEIGHLLGLGHSGVASSIMNPFSETGAGVASRTLQSDDAITATVLYPAATFAPSRGTLAGTITSSTGTPVKSAHVVAISDPGGVPVASQLSGSNGAYQIPGLPPGSYRVLVEPLDGPISLPDFGGFYSDGPDNFATTFLGGLTTPAAVSLAAGQSTPANVVLPPDPMSRLNIDLFGVAVGNSVLLGGGPLFLPRGRQFLLVALEATQATDTTLSLSAPGVSRAGATGGATLTDGRRVRLQDLTVAPGATQAPSNFQLGNANGASVMAGGLVVTVNPQMATPLRDSAGFGATLAPGAFVSIFGTDLANEGRGAVATPLPTNLSGISVKIGNRFAPLFFAGPGQINALIPFEVTGTTADIAVVTGPDAAGNTVRVNLSPTAPGIFSANATGTGQGAIVNLDGSFAAAVGSLPGVTARPARPGELILIFASGLGRVTPALPTGVAAGAGGTAIPTLVNRPQVRIGGQLATVDFAGLAPLFAGLYQLNVRIPNGAPTGPSVSVQITTFEGQTSNTVTIAINP